MELELDEGTVGLTRTVPELVGAKSPAELERFNAKVAGLSASSTADLLPRIETAADPAFIWALHQELHRRGVPPILRGPRQTLGAQGLFVEFCSDVLWLQSRWRFHKPRYGLLQAVFNADPGGPLWHNLLRRHFDKGGSRNARSMTIAFGLDEHQRLDLRAFQTAAMRRKFDDLHGHRFTELVEELVSSISARPDKSGKRSPRETATRRARIWRVYALTGENYARAAEYWNLISGENKPRQMIQRQVDAVAPIARALRAQWTAEE